jgi:prolyl-tRNA synthetase
MEETALREVATPDKRTIEEVSGFLDLTPDSIIKALVYVAGEEPVMALVRGDHSVHESKLARYLRSEVRPAHPDEVKTVTGAEVGFVGPVGLPEGQKLRIVADESLRPQKGVGTRESGEDDNGGSAGPREYAAGANKPHTHLLGVVVGRDFQPNTRT